MPDVLCSVYRRPSLLTALVCLLSWAIFSHAAPAIPEDLSSSQDYLIRGSGISPEPVSPAELHGDALDIWLANHFHYGRYPVFDAKTQDQRIINAARSKYGAVYIHEPSSHARYPSVVSLYSRGNGPAVPVSKNQVQEIEHRLRDARRMGREHGNAARWLMSGRSFSTPSHLLPVNWKEVWRGSPRFALPKSQQDPMWITIRHVLQDRKHVIIHDADQGKLLAFRLSSLGRVEMQVKSLLHNHLKRSLTSSPNSYSEGGLDKIHGAPQELDKRGQTLSGKSRSSFAPRRQTLEITSSVGRGIHVVHDLQPTPAAQLDRRYAHVLHFRGSPVYSIHETDVVDLEQALVDYGTIYVYGTKIGSERLSVVRLFAHEAPSDPAPDSRVLLQVIEQSRLFERRWGSALRAVKDGRPIQRAVPVSSDVHIFMMGRGHEPLDLHELREALSKSGKLTILDLDTTNHIYLQLNERGLADMLTEHAHHFGVTRPGIDIRAVRRQLQTEEPKLQDTHTRPLDGYKLNEEGDELFKVVADTSHRLVKRMHNARDPTTIEFYSSPHFQPGQGLGPLSVEERGSYYADLLHHEGTPIIFPAQDPQPYARARQALRDYCQFWVVGRPRATAAQVGPGGQLRLMAIRHEPGGKMSAAGEEAVFRNIEAMNQFGAHNGQVTKMLKFGPGFPARASGWRRLLPEKAPSWHKVKARAETVSADTPMSEIWQKLHQNGMLVVDDAGSLTGYVLNGAGEVLHQRL